MVEEPDVDKKSKFIFQRINIATDFVLDTHLVMSPMLAKPGDHVLTVPSEETKREDEKIEADRSDEEESVKIIGEKTDNDVTKEDN